jgi:hypothetical protein
VLHDPHLILLYLITLTIFGESYKLRNPSLCSRLQPPATSSLLGPHILLCTLFSNTHNLLDCAAVKCCCRILTFRRTLLPLHPKDGSSTASQPSRPRREFRNILAFYGVEVLKPKLEYHTLFGCMRLPIECISSYPAHLCRRRQSEDAPCCRVTDPWKGRYIALWNVGILTHTVSQIRWTTSLLFTAVKISASGKVCVIHINIGTANL